MNNFIEQNPWAFGLALFGILLALLAPSPFQSFISNFSFENVTENPTEVLTGWIIGAPIAMIGEVFVKAITGLIFGLIGMIVGLIIDSRSNNHGGSFV